MKKIFSIISTIALTGLVTFGATSCIVQERVEYTVPNDYVYFMQERPQYSMLEEENIVKNEDGTQILSLTDKEVEQFKVEMIEAADVIIDEILNGEQRIVTIKNITYNDDFSEVIVEVDKDTMVGVEEYMGLIVANCAVQEQVIFDGIPYDQVNVNIKTVDAETGEVISEGQYLDLKAQYVK